MVAGLSAEELPATETIGPKGRCSLREGPTEGAHGKPGDKLTQRPPGWKGLGCADGDTELQGEASARASAAHGTPALCASTQNAPILAVTPKFLLCPLVQTLCKYHPEAWGYVPQPSTPPPYD